MRKLFIVPFLVVFILALAEIGLRMAGFKPWTPDPVTDDIVWKPECPWNRDSTLGIKLNGGDYRVCYNNQHTITLSNNRFGYRITSPDTNMTNVKGKRKIKVFGDSFTQGCGLNNEETYCWLLQEKLPCCAVYNYAGPGYGLANIYSQITETVKPDSGDIYVIAYSIDEDNRFENRSLKMAIARPDLCNKIGILKLSDKLSTQFYSFEYKMWPLSPYSALSNLAEDLWNDWSDKRETEKSHDISREAIALLNKYCRERGAKLVVAGISQRGTENMLAYCKQEGIMQTDISVDEFNEAFNQHPYNDQPNAHANKLYADRLFGYFNQQGLVD